MDTTEDIKEPPMMEAEEGLGADNDIRESEKEELPEEDKDSAEEGCLEEDYPQFPSQSDKLGSVPGLFVIIFSR